MLERSSLIRCTFASVVLLTSAGASRAEEVIPPTEEADIATIVKTIEVDSDRIRDGVLQRLVQGVLGRHPSISAERNREHNRPCVPRSSRGQARRAVRRRSDSASINTDSTGSARRTRAPTIRARTGNRWSRVPS